MFARPTQPNHKMTVSYLEIVTRFSMELSVNLQQINLQQGMFQQSYVLIIQDSGWVVGNKSTIFEYYGLSRQSKRAAEC